MFYLMFYVLCGWNQTWKKYFSTFELLLLVYALTASITMKLSFFFSIDACKLYQFGQKVNCILLTNVNMDTAD